jgi:dethiobiotin synthetase
VRGLFITGTDTGVGKTVVTAAIVAALRAAHRDAIGLKPVVTGTDEAADPPWPADHELLAQVSGVAPGEVNVLAYGPPVSPHLAADLANTPIDAAALRQAIARAAAGRALAIVEGVGGLLVPLSASYDVADLAADLKLRVIVVARAGLGTINHTRLALEAARSRGLHLAAVVLNRWPERPGTIERSNQETIAALGAVEVATFPEVTGPEPAGLARAGATLPLERWLVSETKGDSEGSGLCRSGLAAGAAAPL